MMEAQAHWETVYQTKQPHEVSWTEAVPVRSLDLIRSLGLPADAHIVDIGGGDSHLVDHLLAMGFTNITVLDISSAALERARQRLGARADRVRWVAANVLDFVPHAPIDLWHDRAAFHFFTQPQEVQRYLTLMNTHVTGHAIIAAFSTNGPKRCSGLPVQQYSEGTMCTLMQDSFQKLSCDTITHITPSAAEQEFLYCGFRKMAGRKIED